MALSVKGSGQALRRETFRIADSERLITVLNARIVTCRSSASGRLRLPADPRCSPYRGRSRAGRLGLGHEDRA